MKSLNLILFLFFACIAILPSFGQAIATYNEVISKQKTGSIDKYITQNGEIFKVGDTITLGVSFRNDYFDYIQQDFGIEFYALSNTASNSKVVIKKIAIRSKTVVVNTTKPYGFIHGLKVRNFDSAISSGEIVSKIMTSDQALTELKKWKDKFDLGLISEEFYKQKKEELSKFIK